MNISKKLAQGVIGTANTDLYTVPEGTQGIIKKIVLVNTSGAGCWVKLFNGGYEDSNVILPAITIGAGGFGEWNGEMSMFDSDVMAGIAQTADSITYTIYGEEKS